MKQKMEINSCLQEDGGGKNLFGQNASRLLRKSSPNILESLSYNECNLHGELKYLKRLLMDSPLMCQRLRTKSITRSPQFCETLERHAFMQNVINTKHFSNYEIRYSSPSQKEANVRRSLQEISKDIQEIEDFLTITENLIRKQNDSNLWKSRKPRSTASYRNSAKTNSYPNRNVTYKINSLKRRCSKVKASSSPRFTGSRLYFRNGRIGCLEAENSATSNIESTHALVKHILKYEFEKPLVSPDSVRRVLNSYNEQPSKKSSICNEEGGSTYSRNDNTNSNSIQDPSQENTLIENKEPVIENAKESPKVLSTCQNSTAVLANAEISASNNSSLNSTKERQLSKNNSPSKDSNQLNLQMAIPSSPAAITPPVVITSSSPTKYNHSVDNKQVSTPKRSNPITSLKLLKKSGVFEADTPKSNTSLLANLCSSNNDQNTLDPQGKIYIAWLCVVSISFLYNAWVIPLRSAFPFQTPENTNVWLISDFCADVIYLLDVIFFKHRLMYLFEGFWVKDKNLTRKNYMRKLQFKLDLLALLPLELLYFKYGTKAVYLRFPRFFKIQSFWEFFKLLDRVISSPHIVRIAKTLMYMLYMIHLTATFYYAYSDYQGLGVNRWVFNGKGHPYVRCFAFATKTATSIGKNPKPEREGEFVFMTAAWLMGVFVFALLIGQIRDIISTATRTRNEYRLLEDETLEYMRRMNLPNDVQKRVKMWFKFTWEQQRTLDESTILDSLPINLKTDIAISVHIQTLSKVQLFADCEEALLRDLVLKLRAVTFLPGDYVCRKGEVGREMYIIKLGQVEVMGGPNQNTVLATLSEGSVFGEISLLGINGADRRTADVRSSGFANLFVLSKSDLNEVIAHYPNAQAILKKRARAIMRKNAAREKEERKQRRTCKAADLTGNGKLSKNNPKIIQTVIQTLPYELPAVMLITHGSKDWENKYQQNSLEIETPNEGNIKEIAGFKVNAESKEGLKFRKGLTSNYRDLSETKQSALENEKNFINLTDSEKVLISPSNESHFIEPTN